MITLISQQSDQPEHQDSVAVAHLCAGLDISSATFYWQREQVLKPDPEEMIIRDHLQRIALEWPSYGYRTITAELGRRYKTEPVNRKRVLRMMRELHADARGPSDSDQHESERKPLRQCSM
jgi:hypothetical protein